MEHEGTKAAKNAKREGREEAGAAGGLEMAELTVLDEIRAEIGKLPLADQARVMEAAAMMLQKCSGDPLFLMAFVLVGAELQELAPEG